MVQWWLTKDNAFFTDCTAAQFPGEDSGAWAIVSWTLLRDASLYGI